MMATNTKPARKASVKAKKTTAKKASASDPIAKMKAQLAKKNKELGALKKAMSALTKKITQAVAKKAAAKKAAAKKAVAKKAAAKKAVAKKRVVKKAATKKIAAKKRVVKKAAPKKRVVKKAAAMIAMMLITDPDLLIADEPTSALDVTVQMQVLAIIDDLVAERGLGLIFISHDLSLVASFCDRVLVMYGGQIMESCAARDLQNARHPYTQGLLNCLPQIDGRHDFLPVLQRDPLWLE